MNADRFLEGGKVFLSPLKAADSPDMVRFMNAEDVRMLARSRRDAVNERTGAKVVEDLIKRQEAFLIRRRADEAPIGYALIIDRDEFNREAMLGIAIGEASERGKGYGKEALALLLRHCFVDLNLESVYLRVFDYNKVAIAAYEKAGFKTVGVRRHARIVGDRCRDELIMDMIASEYFERYGRTYAQRYGI